MSAGPHWARSKHPVNKKTVDWASSKFGRTWQNLTKLSWIWLNLDEKEAALSA